MSDVGGRLPPMSSGRLITTYAIRIIGGTILLFLVLVVIESLFPGVSPLFYDDLGSYATTDLEGRPLEVSVTAKNTNNMIPPGVKPKIRVRASGEGGGSSISFATGWRFGVGRIQPVPGGIDIYTGLQCCVGGVRFSMKGGRWMPPSPADWPVGPESLSGLEGKVRAELIPLVNLIHNSPHPDAARIDPAALVRAVNGLRSAGRERAIEALRAYQKLCGLHPDSLEARDLPLDERCPEHRMVAARILPILVLLFGDSVVPERSRNIVLIDQLPFLIAREGLGENSLPGDWEDKARRLAFQGVPLSPEKPPLDAALQLLGQGRENDSKVLVRCQAIWGTYPAVSLSRDEGDHWIPTDAQWEEFCKSARRVNLKWSSTLEAYVHSP